MQAILAIPVTLSALFGGAFLTNEWSHGAMSEGMGLGHHHMLDYGGFHCARHTDTGLGPMHLEHMHGNHSMPHAHCPGGAGMHQGHQSMHGGTA